MVELEALPVQLAAAREAWLADRTDPVKFETYGYGAGIYRTNETTDNYHWFCEPEKYDASLSSMVMFSYDDTLPELHQYCVALGRVLGRCPKCAIVYQGTREPLAERYAEIRIPEPDSRAMVDAISLSDRKRLALSLDTAAMALRQKGAPRAGQDLLMPVQMAQSLLNVNVIEVLHSYCCLSDSRFLSFITRLKPYLLLGDGALREYSCAPGLISLLFTDDPETHKFAFSHLFAQPGALARVWTPEHTKFYVQASAQVQLINRQDYTWYNISLIAGAFADVSKQAELQAIFQSQAAELTALIPSSGRRTGACSAFAAFLGLNLEFSDADLLSILRSLLPTNFSSELPPDAAVTLPGDYVRQDPCGVNGSVQHILTSLTALITDRKDMIVTTTVVNYVLSVLLSDKNALNRFGPETMAILDKMLGRPGNGMFKREEVNARLETFKLVSNATSALTQLFTKASQSSTSQEYMHALAAIVQFHVTCLLFGSTGYDLKSERERKDLLVWEVLCRDHQLMRNDLKLVKTILVGQELLPFVYDNAPGVGKAEESVAIMFDLLGRHSHSKETKELMQSHDCAVAVLLSTFSPVNRTAQAASGLWVDINGDSGELVSATAEFLKVNIDGSIAVIISVVDKIIQMNRYAVMPSVIKFLSTVFEVLYENGGGLASQLQSQLAACSTNVLMRLWTSTWELLAFSTDNIRRWAAGGADRKSMSAYISATFVLYQRLLSGFSQVASNMPPTESSVDSKLIQPAAKAIVKMGDLLKLRDQELLDMGYAIYFEIVTLIKRHSVPTPASLIVSLTDLAGSASLIPADQYGALLTLTRHFSNEEISELCETRGRRMSELRGETPPAKPNAAPATSSTRASGSTTVTSVAKAASKSTPACKDEDLEGVVAVSGTMAGPRLPSQRQGRLDQYYAKVPASAIRAQPSRITTGREIRPSAQSQLSATEAMRRRLAESKHGSTSIPTPQAPPPIEIHPARPAGFNSRKKPDTAEPKRPIATLATHQHSIDSMDGSGSEDEHDGVLFRLGKNASKTAPRALTNGRDQLLEKERLEKSLRRMRARLSMSADGLHRAVLMWDYFSDSAYPKGFSRDNMSVPDRFNSVQEYQDIMTPLLHLEAWQGIQRARSEGPEKLFNIIVGKRVTVDDFTDLYASVKTREWEDAKVGESDLILLSFDKRSINQENDRAVVPRSDMARCFARVKDGTVVWKRSKGYVDLQLRTQPDMKMKFYLSQGRVLNGLKVTSLKTVDREYTALMALEHYDLASEILAAQPARLIDFPPEQVHSVSNTLGLNDSQAKAVLQSLNSTGFNLIQGPPGTGKTKTILGFLSAFFGNGVKDSTKRILLCAPSNAAVDELLLRIKRGVPGQSGQPLNLSVVRLGRPEVVNDEVRQFTLDARISSAVTVTAQPEDTGLKANHQKLLQQRALIDQKLGDIEQGALDAEGVKTLEEERFNINVKIRESGKLVTAQNESLKVIKESQSREYKKVQSEILANANIVCATLSGAAYEFLASLQLTFETVIIDEAAQSVELSALIPLKYGCRRCLLVGDPNQLPPTVLSREAKNLKYEQSLFVRMFNQHKSQVRMLDTQFRMHPDISSFPSQEFYNGKLLDGAGMAEKTAAPWHQDPLFGPYRFFNVSGSHERAGNKSFWNQHEATVAVELIKEVKRRFPHVLLANRLGIISPYKQQVNLLRDKFRRAFGSEIVEKISFSTVDGFQGQEKDIIIMSCVRAERDATGVGFLADTRRMNVAITRAKSSLWVLGYPPALRTNAVWKRTVDDAQMRGMYVNNVAPGTIARNECRVTPARTKAENARGSSAENSFKDFLGSSPERSARAEELEHSATEFEHAQDQELHQEPRQEPHPESSDLRSERSESPASQARASPHASRGPDASSSSGSESDQDEAGEREELHQQHTNSSSPVRPSSEQRRSRRSSNNPTRNRPPSDHRLPPVGPEYLGSLPIEQRLSPRVGPEVSSSSAPIKARFAPRPPSGPRPDGDRRPGRRLSADKRPHQEQPDLFPTRFGGLHKHKLPTSPGTERDPKRSRNETGHANPPRKRPEPSVFIRSKRRP